MLIGIYSVCQAKPWQDYTLYTAPADGDHLMLNDISDPTDDADGTLKRLAWLYVQPRDADLTSIAALSTTAYGRALLELAQAANGKILIGNGTDTPTMALMTETGDALTISVGAGTINFVPHANLEDLTDGILEYNLSLSDGVTDSPVMTWQDATTETFNIYKADGANAVFYINHADDRTIQMYNAGDGNLNVTVDGFVESDLYRRFNTDKPAGAEIDQVYGADGVTWNPTSGDILVNHYVKYVEPPAAECIAEDNPHDCCTGAEAGATCEETWLLTEGPDGVQYISSIELPSYAHWATAEMPYNDTSTPHDLTAAEVRGGNLTDCGATGNNVYQLMASDHGMNFAMTTCSTTADRDMTLTPFSGELLTLNSTPMAVDESIINTGETAGDVIACFSMESGDGTFSLFCNSSNSNWAEATPP